ncbi:uncharacterized protein LOC127286002 [Leptopilina boulardi]|uniref:uncharacterized protein LOC127286002 n=1 Tax=Leptopilina boulardi TaxID=63433 RepID=UPI0021F60F0A|nr:uncharacterized protein LOC127286002 [Leptopilina boulardi]
MNKTNILIRPLENVQFLSITNLIIVLGDLLQNDTEFSVLEDKFEPIPIVNYLCEFLDKNIQKENKILALGHKLLQETDLYGSKLNETLDLKFVNAVLNHIIENTVFSKFGNTFGYLSAIVNSANDLRIRSVKKRIIKNLHQQIFLSDNGAFFTLSNTTIARITKNIIFPLFPKPKKNMKIIHFKYIYAQAGWLFLQNVEKNIRKITFSKLIQLALNVQQEVMQGNIDPSALQIFQLPALLYYTHHKKHGIKRKNLKSIMVSTIFWQKVYRRFFADLNVTIEKMSIFHKRNPSFQFQTAFANFQNRTALAETILRKNCPNITNYKSKINDYKNNPTDYYCNKQLLPNVNEIFFKQNRIIAEKYYYYEKHLINHVFDEDLKKFIDQTNVTIKPIKDFWNNQCFRCAILSGRPILSDGIDLFQISDGGEKKMIYALIRSTNGMKLVPATDMNSFLQNEIGLNTRAKLDVPFMAEDMKSASEDDNFNTFATYIAKYREKKFLANLKSAGYEATTVEYVANFFKHLIPFYSCADAIHDSDTSTHTAVMTCIFDSLVFFPVFGLGASAGMKITSATMRSTALRLGAHMETLTLKEAFKAIMKIGFRIIATDIIDSFSQIITKEFIQNFGITILRSLDPGIEFSYMLTKAGVKTLVKSWEFLRKQFSVNSFEQLKSVTSVKIGTYKGYDVHVQSFTGKEGFGLKTIDYHDRIVELRRIRGYADEMPVVVINNSKRNNKYKIIDLETGELGETVWEVKDQILVVVDKPLRNHLKIIQREGFGGKGAVRTGQIRNNAFNAVELKKTEALNLVKAPKFKKIVDDGLSNHVFYLGSKFNAISFVQHWLTFKKFPEWSHAYKLADPELYSKIRFHIFLEDIELNQIEAVNGVFNHYGQQYVRDVIEVDPVILFKFYKRNMLYDSISFNDQFALGNYVISGYKRVHLDDFEGRHMRRALYTTAVRQFDNNIAFSKFIDNFLYTVDIRHINEMTSTHIGKIMDINQFMVLSLSKNDLLSRFNGVIDNSLIRVLHEIKLDHHCLAVFMMEYLPFRTHDSILLPGVKLRLNSMKFDTIEGENVFVINWKNVEFDKAKWLAETTNKIKHIMDQEQAALQVENDILNSFDTSLLRR